MEQSKRLALLDEIRGFTLISMILYHFVWDLVYIAVFSIPWYQSLGAYLWQQSICWTFIFLSGFCFPLGRKHLKRGLTVWLAGGVVTIVTLLFLPEDRIIFGVLTLLGSSMLLMIPIDKLLQNVTRESVHMILLFLSLALFLLFKPVSHGYLTDFAAILSGNFGADRGIQMPMALYRGWLAAYMGFPGAGFFSTDYFPLLPWFFLFAAGYFFHKVCAHRGLLRTPLLRHEPLPVLSAIGRHSLWVYMLHQPVLYLVTLLIMQFFRL